METKEIQLQLKNYWVDQISFSHIRDFVWPKGGVKIDPTLERQVIEKEDDNVVVQIRITISGSKENPIPFQLSLVVGGLFKCPGYKDSEEGKFIINNNTTAILFPYLRQAVTQITSLSGLPPYVLPIVNTSLIFDKKDK